LALEIIDLNSEMKEIYDQCTPEEKKDQSVSDDINFLLKEMVKQRQTRTLSAKCSRSNLMESKENGFSDEVKKQNEEKFENDMLYLCRGDTFNPSKSCYIQEINLENDKEKTVDRTQRAKFSHIEITEFL